MTSPLNHAAESTADSAGRASVDARVVMQICVALRRWWDDAPDATEQLVRAAEMLDAARPRRSQLNGVLDHLATSHETLENSPAGDRWLKRERRMEFEVSAVRAERIVTGWISPRQSARHLRLELWRRYPALFLWDPRQLTAIRAHSDVHDRDGDDLTVARFVPFSALPGVSRPYEPWDSDLQNNVRAMAERLDDGERISVAEDVRRLAPLMADAKDLPKGMPASLYKAWRNLQVCAVLFGSDAERDVVTLLKSSLLIVGAHDRFAINEPMLTSVPSSSVSSSASLAVEPPMVAPPDLSTLAPSA